MSAISPPWALQASSHPADAFRRMSRFLASGQQGVRPNVVGDLAVTPNGSPNMSVNVAAGEALINGSQNLTSQGSYECLNDATVNLAIAASDPTNPRIDIVCASVQDSAYSGANNQFLLQVVTGTPAPSPAPPATPANSIVLAQVAVAANATSITSGNITDKRTIFGSSFHAEVYRNAAQTIGTTPALIPYDTIEADPNGNFTTGASANYTCPVPGRYGVACLIFVNTTTTLDVVAAAYRNGSESRRLGNGYSTTNASAGGFAVLRCQNGDTLDIRAFFGIATGSVALFTGAPFCWAQFYYLGPN